MKKFQENIVPSTNQNVESFYQYGRGDKLKILFIGNSITKHSPKPSINWLNDCGMAASDISKDYVHQLISMVEEVKGEVSFAILPIANFERNIKNYDIETKFSLAKSYDADIIIMFFGANVNKDILNEPEKFGIAYKNLRNYFCNGNKTKIFHSSGFYLRPQFDIEKKKVSEQYGDVFIDIGDISNCDEAHGLFNHPNDFGMREIAIRFFEEIKPYI